MAKGDTYPPEAKEFKDEETGRLLRQLTDCGAHCRHLYLYAPTITRDGGTLIFISGRGGTQNFCTMDLETGESRQLTDAPGIFAGGSWFVESVRKIFYWQGTTVKSVNIDTLEEEEIFTAPEQGSYLAAAGDGSLVAYARTADDARDDMILYAVDLTGERAGVERALVRCPFNISHVQINPADADQVVFCWEGSWVKVPQRIWWSDAEGVDGGPLGPQPPNQARGHEFFTSDGAEMGFHGRKHDAMGEPGASFFGIMNADGTDVRLYETPGETGHCQMSPDKSKVVCDRGGDTEGDGIVALIHLDHGKLRGEFEPLHSHGASWVTQGAHPHPQFTSDGEWAVFTTDRNGPRAGIAGGKGFSNVCMVECG